LAAALASLPRRRDAVIDYVMTGPDTLEVTVGGHITKAEIDRLWARLDADLPKEGKLKVLEMIDPLQGIEPMALFEHLHHAFPKIHRFSRAAIVADQNWILAVANFAGMFTAAQVKTFPRDQVEAARTWLAGA
jgi:hypothetical protein